MPSEFAENLPVARIYSQIPSIFHRENLRLQSPNTAHVNSSMNIEAPNNATNPLIKADSAKLSNICPSSAFNDFEAAIAPSMLSRARKADQVPKRYHTNILHSEDHPIK